MSQMSRSKGLAQEASRATPAIGGSGVEVGTYHYGFFDSLTTDMAKARCGVGDNGPAYKSAHFLAVRMTFTLENFCKLYIQEIVRLHGVPISIVLNHDLGFMAHFDDEHCLSSTDRQPVEENHTGLRGHAASKCPRF